MRYLNRLKRILTRPKVVIRNRGYCPTCAQMTLFISRDKWLRDHYRCTNCRSKPRERALMEVLERNFPHWREQAIHESSPVARGASLRLKNECVNYTATQFFPDVELGSTHNEVRCEDLRRMTFHDASIDLHVTQDVLEHVFDAESVFRDIARTLRPGGAHIFTVPLVRKHLATRVRAIQEPSGEVRHLEEPAYHGNPIDSKGALVTYDWGYDICDFINVATGMTTTVVHLETERLGILGEYTEVLVSRKR